MSCSCLIPLLPRIYFSITLCCQKQCSDTERTQEVEDVQVSILILLLLTSCLSLLTQSSTGLSGCRLLLPLSGGLQIHVRVCGCYSPLLRQWQDVRPKSLHLSLHFPGPQPICDGPSVSYSSTSLPSIRRLP